MWRRLIACLAALMMVAPAVRAEGTAPVDVGYRMLMPLHKAHDQFVCSPESLCAALSMAARGAAGETRAQLETLLGGVGAPDFDGFDQVRSANAALVAPGIALKDDYLAALEDDFGALMMPLDGDVVDVLNGWVLERTDGMIDQVLTEKPDDRVKLILANALALDAEWSIPFESAQTRDGTFYGASGERSVPFMFKRAGFDYAESDGLQAVRLPYDGGQLEMIVALPAAGGMEDLLLALSERGPSALGAFSGRREVRLSMPKVALESELELEQLVQGLGAVDAFGGKADFSGMTDSVELYLSAVIQKARIDVDEDGTRAAAATVAMAAAKGLVLDAVDMVVDRPFLMLVRAVDGGELLFAAVVQDP